MTISTEPQKITTKLERIYVEALPGRTLGELAAVIQAHIKEYGAGTILETEFSDTEIVIRQTREERPDEVAERLNKRRKALSEQAKALIHEGNGLIKPICDLGFMNLLNADDEE